MKIIICEDDPIQVIDLAEIASACGAEVCGTFRCSRTALVAAKQMMPDLALIDLNLADGETGAGLASDLTLLGCRVVVVSGISRPHAQLGSIPHTYISKPVITAALNEVLPTTASRAAK